MYTDLSQEIAALRELKIPELRIRYKELFGDDSRSSNRQFLFRRIAWRLQALAEGDLTERARNRALLLARDADLKVRPPRSFRGFTTEESKRDWRLPSPGTVLKRRFSDALHRVTVKEDGFEYGGQLYRSLSAVAFAISGTRWNGYKFFGLEASTHA
jgi:hypothetical protein